MARITATYGKIVIGRSALVRQQCARISARVRHPNLSSDEDCEHGFIINCSPASNSFSAWMTGQVLSIGNDFGHSSGGTVKLK